MYTCVCDVDTCGHFMYMLLTFYRLVERNGCLLFPTMTYTISSKLVFSFFLFFFFLVFSWSWKCPTHLVFKVNYSKSSRNLRIKWKFFHGGTSDLPLHVPPLPLLQPLPSRFKLACSSSIFYISMHIFMLEHGIFPDLSSLFLSIHFQFSVQISFPWNHFCKVSFVTYHHHAKSKARECPPSIISALFLY